MAGKRRENIDCPVDSGARRHKEKQNSGLRGAKVCK